MRTRPRIQDRPTGIDGTGPSIFDGCLYATMLLFMTAVMVWWTFWFVTGRF